jgi:hypothetical protein
MAVQRIPAFAPTPRNSTRQICSVSLSPHTSAERGLRACTPSMRVAGSSAVLGADCNHTADPAAHNKTRATFVRKNSAIGTCFYF